MAFVQSDLDRLDAAYATGVRSITFSDRVFTFHSVDDYLKLRREMIADITSATGTPSTRYGATSKGTGRGAGSLGGWGGWGPWRR